MNFCLPVKIRTMTKYHITEHTKTLQSYTHKYIYTVQERQKLQDQEESNMDSLWNSYNSKALCFQGSVVLFPDTFCGGYQHLKHSFTTSSVA